MQTITSMTVKTLISLRSDDIFKLYWQKVSREVEELKAISKPKLLRKKEFPSDWMTVQPLEIIHQS